MTAQKFYWLSHQRYVESGRLAWFAEEPSPEFWADYWKKSVSPDQAKEVEYDFLQQDDLGKLLIANLNAHGKHIDAGCGTGVLVAALQKKGYDIRGIDSSLELIQYLRAIHHEVPVHLGDALSMPVPDATYDSYISIGVVEHREQGPEPFLTEAYRVLKPRGKLIISVPHFGPVRRFKSFLGAYAHQKPSTPFFQYAFTKEEFVKLIRMAGFNVLSTHVHYAHRMLLEESALYRFAMQLRGARLMKKMAEALINPWDGHMLTVIAEKS